MSSIVISGDTSGAITISAPAVSGTNTLTLPASTGNVVVDSATQTLTNKSITATQLTGTIDKARLPTGSILQVISSVLDPNVSTTSASFVTTGLTVSITPTSSSNKILIIATGIGYTPNSSSQADYTIYRNNTNLAVDMMGQLYSSAGGVESTIAMHFLDSPATTSSTSYTVYYKASGGTAYFSLAKTSSITVMEIAA